jgi:hypothetical protein
MVTETGMLRLQEVLLHFTWKAVNANDNVSDFDL